MNTHAIDHLLKQRQDLWRGRGGPSGPVLATGHPGLDARLPGGGWPGGRLTELLPSHLGAGEFELLLPALARLTREGRPVVLIAPPMVPCPQAMAQRQLDLARLIVIRSRQQRNWAAEQCLKSGLCGAVVVWQQQALNRASTQALRRLQLAAESSRGAAFLIYHPGQRPPPSIATLRLAVAPGPRIRLLRAPGRDGDERWFGPAADNVVALHG